MCIIVVLFLAFACDEDSADDAGQQQDADDLERQHVAIFAAAHQRVADRLHVRQTTLVPSGKAHVRHDDLPVERRESGDAFEDAGT